MYAYPMGYVVNLSKINGTHMHIYMHNTKVVLHVRVHVCSEVRLCNTITQWCPQSPSSHNAPNRGAERHYYPGYSGIVHSGTMIQVVTLWP